MSFVSGDRILETSNTTGSGATITLLGAVAGYRAFSAVATVNGDRFVYALSGGTEWEVGIGTRTAATTFTRDTILSSSNAGAIVTLSAGVKLVWIDDPAKLSAQSMFADLGANLIINGRFDVDQERAGAGVTITGSPSIYFADQWVAQETAAAIANVVAVPTTPIDSPSFGRQFMNSARLTCGTGGAIGAGEVVLCWQPMEGARMMKLGYGATGAMTSTLGFWVYSTITGQCSIFVVNAAVNRSFVKSFTINTAATWEFKTITVPGDTTGTWVANPNHAAIVGFGVAVGSSLFGTDNTWNAAERYGVSGQTNLFASSSNVFSVTGVAWVPGDLILPEQWSAAWGRPFDEEFPLCQRYLEKSFNYSVAPAQNVGIETGEYSSGALVAGAATNRLPKVQFIVRKRAAPTMTFYNPANANANARDGTAGVDCGAVTAGTTSETGVRVAIVGNAATSVSNSIHFHWMANSRLI